MNNKYDVQAVAVAIFPKGGCPKSNHPSLAMPLCYGVTVYQLKKFLYA